MNEKQLTESIKKYLKTVPSLFFWKEHGGQFGSSGIPDIIVCYRGKFIAFEVKAKNNKPTILQQVTIKQILRAGGYALVVRSVEDVRVIIEALSKE